MYWHRTGDYIPVMAPVPCEGYRTQVIVLSDGRVHIFTEPEPELTEKTAP